MPYYYAPVGQVPIPPNGSPPDSLEGNWTNVTCPSSDPDCGWTYSSCETAGLPHQNGTTDLKAQQRRKFEGVFKTLRDELLDHLKGENMPAEGVEWFRRVRPPPGIVVFDVDADVVWFR